MKLSDAALKGIETTRPYSGGFCTHPSQADPDRRLYACLIGAAVIGAGAYDPQRSPGAIALDLWPYLAGNSPAEIVIFGNLPIWDWIVSTNDRMTKENTHDRYEHPPRPEPDPRPWIAHELAEAGF